MLNAEIKKNSLWIITVMASVMLILLSGGIWFYKAEKIAIWQQVELQLDSIAHLKVAQISAWRNARLDDAAVLTESPFLAEGVSHFLDNPNTKNIEALRNRFQSIQTHYHYTDVLMVEPEGRLRFSLSGITEINNIYRIALTDALRERKPKIIDLHTESYHVEPHLSVVAPIFTGYGQVPTPIGAIILVYDAKDNPIHDHR